MGVTRRTTALLLSCAALIGAACGGGGDSDEADSTDPPVTDSPATDPPVETALPATAPPVTAPPVETDPPATDPPVETDPPATDPPVTNPSRGDDELDLDAVLAFCGVSERYYVSATALTVYAQTPDGVRLLLSDTVVLADEAIAAAPRDDMASAPMRAAVALATLRSGFDEVGYDLERLGEATTPGLAEAFDEFDATYTELALFLSEGCQVDLAPLDAEAQAAAEQADAGSTDGGTEASVQVDDASGQIASLVPAGWSDVDGSPDGDSRQLIAAPSIPTFLTSYTEPGIFILSGDAAGLADQAAAGGLEGALGDAVSSGCQIVERLGYDDGLYTGEEVRLTCPGDDTTFFAIGGSNADNDVWFVLLLVTEAGDSTTRQLVVDSFTVD